MTPIKPGITRRTFTVIGAINPAAGVDPGSVLSITDRGGDVVDDGETLSVVDEAQGRIVPGGTYLLALVRGNVESRFYPETAVPIVPLRNERLDPEVGRWQEFGAGTRLDEVRSAMLATIRLSPCR